MVNEEFKKAVKEYQIADDIYVAISIQLQKHFIEHIEYVHEQISKEPKEHDPAMSLNDLSYWLGSSMCSMLYGEITADELEQEKNIILNNLFLYFCNGWFKKQSYIIGGSLKEITKRF